jgi:hypothetical protein
MSRPRCNVWVDFDEVFEEVNGVMIRTQAVCKICRTSLHARSTDGLGHLVRHLKVCKAKVANDADAGA